MINKDGIPAIIEYLRSTLDFSQSQSIAQSLYDLYSYIIDQLADASLGVIIQPIDNAIRTLMPIKKAWDSIPVSAQQEASSKRTQEQWNVELNNAESMASGHV